MDPDPPAEEDFPWEQHSPEPDSHPTLSSSSYASPLHREHVRCDVTEHLCCEARKICKNTTSALKNDVEDLQIDDYRWNSERNKQYLADIAVLREDSDPEEDASDADYEADYDADYEPYMLEDMEDMEDELDAQRKGRRAASYPYRRPIPHQLSHHAPPSTHHSPSTTILPSSIPHPAASPIQHPPSNANASKNFPNSFPPSSTPHPLSPIILMHQHPSSGKARLEKPVLWKTPSPRFSAAQSYRRSCRSSPPPTESYLVFLRPAVGGGLDLHDRLIHGQFGGIFPRDFAVELLVEIPRMFSCAAHLPTQQHLPASFHSTRRSHASITHSHEDTKCKTVVRDHVVLSCGRMGKSSVDGGDIKTLGKNTDTSRRSKRPRRARAPRTRWRRPGPRPDRAPSPPPGTATRADVAIGTRNRSTRVRRSPRLSRRRWETESCSAPCFFWGNRRKFNKNEFGKPLGRNLCTIVNATTVRTTRDV